MTAYLQDIRAHQKLYLCYSYTGGIS